MRVTKATSPAWIAAALTALLWMGASASQAAPINYGDFAGSSVMYLDVTETANTPDDEEPLYGAPDIIGNTLDFDPAGFSASAECGHGDLTDGQLNITLMGSGGAAIDSISIAESGDFTLVGSGTDATQVTYGLSLASVVVLEIDGMTLDTPLVLDAANAFGSANLADDGPVSGAPWSLGLLYDVNAALASAGADFTTGATKIEIAVDNSLAAISEMSTIAFIAKKDFRIDVGTTPVPEPALGLLGVVALAGLGMRSRRS